MSATYDYDGPAPLHAFTEESEYADFGYPSRSQRTDETDLPGVASSWQPIDLGPALEGRGIDPPTVLRRSDGLALLYPGRVHWLQGESETLKSWVTQVATVQELEAGNSVLYIDFEDDDRGVTARLVALGAKPDTIRRCLTYVRPDEPIRPRKDGRFSQAQLDFETVLDGRPTLTVIDGVTEAMGAEGYDLLSNQDIAEWMRLVPKRIASVTGAAVVCIDHVTKNSETRGRYAIGGQHKLAGVTGAAYSVKLLRPFARATGADPVEGAVQIRVEKDRPGYIRGRTLEGKAAVLELTSYVDGGVTARLAPPTQGEMAPSPDLLGRIVDYLKVYDGASKNKLETDVQGNTDSKRAAIAWMVEHGRIRVEKDRLSHRHYLIVED